MMHRQHQNLHRALGERAPAPALTTIDGLVMSVVYVTAQPTFTGVIGGYTTIGQSDEEDSTDYGQATRNSDPQSATAPAQAPQSQQTYTPASRASSPVANTLASAPATSAVGGPVHPAAPTDQGSYTNAGYYGPTSTDAPHASNASEGMSMGAKIGLAVGVILGVGAIAIVALIFLARKRRQKEEQEQADSEKKSFGAPPVKADPDATAVPNAPRLSLRPVSNLMPDLLNGSKQKNRLSQGNMLTPISESARARNLSPPQTSAHAPIPMSDRPRTGDNPFRDPENPFADPEKVAGMPKSGSRSPVSPLAPAALAAPTAVAMSAAAVHDTPQDNRSSDPTAESFPLPQSQTHAYPAPLNGQAPSSRSGPPAPIAISNVTYAELPAAPSPTVAQGPGPETPQGNVYRILMDFRPTMEDELELRAGQLVRMLHEYDDGWALCIRLDRSQQGVVPRTCLAAKPSKPRPGPPPMGAGPRPITPQGRPRGPGNPPYPQGPQGIPAPGLGSPRGHESTPVRAQSPATLPNTNTSTVTTTGAFNQPPRPLSPGPRPRPQKRSMSPGPYGAGGPKPMAPAQQRRRSNSASALSVRNKRNSPPGPSKLGPGAPPARSDSPGLAM